MSLDLPAAFGRFTLLERLGEGGMGTVYRASFDGPSGFRKEVAVKLLLTEPGRDPAKQAEQLAKEARIGALLRHPNLVDLYDMGVADGQTWFSMELVPGQSLEALIHQDAPVEPARAVQLLSQIALALAAIHELTIDGEPAGLVHQDLKPANVLVTADDHVKVADFGISRGQHEMVSTRTNTLRGTPAYMAPEQAREEELTARADLFALGLIGWELITGQRFLAGDSMFAVMFGLLQIEERLEEVRSLDVQVPGLGTLLAECLREDPAHRPASARIVRDRLLVLELREAAAFVRTWTATTTGAPVVEPALAPTTVLGNLSAGHDLFVGRTAELSTLAAALGVPGRVVSVLGPGGTGKTRLVRELGARVQAEYPAGVWLIDLTEARSLDGICADVARELNIPLDRGADSPAERIGATLQGRGRALLLFDNFEQVAAHAPQTVGAWAQRCPHLRFVVTTRQRLGLGHEHVFRLGPLRTGSGAELPLDELASQPAIALFVARAQQRRAGFALNDGNAGTVAALVTALEGIPLAIELAAARVRVLSPARLLERLPQRFELLSTDRTDVTSRQATLKATIAWSWTLLEPWEQTALAQSSVFRGGFTAEAAEAVLDVSAWPTAPWALDVLESLEDKSLLRSVEAPSGEVRFVHYESIREFAQEHLTPDDGAADRHLAHFGTCGTEAAIGRLYVPGSVGRRARLGEDLENLGQAAAHAAAVGDGTGAAHAALAMSEVLRARGPLELAVRTLGAALQLPSTPVREQVRCLIDRGYLRSLQGDNAGGGEDLLDAAARAQAIGEDVLRAWALSELGRAKAYGPESGQTEQLEEALVVFRAAGDRLLEGRALCALAIRDAVQGKFVQARARNEAALQLVQRTGDRQSEMVALANLGVAYKELGMGVLELATLNEALRLARELGALRQEGVLLVNLGVHHQLEGRLAEAEQLYRDALRRCRETGHLDLEEVSLANIGDVLKDRGDLPGAEAALREALECAVRGGHVRFRPAILGMLAQVVVGQGRLDEAEPILDEAEELAPQLGNPRHAGEVATWRAIWHRRRGEFEDGQRVATEAEEMTRELPEPRFWLRARIERAEILLAAGDAAGARDLLESCADEVRGVRDPFLLGLLLSVWGRAQLASGLTAAATAAELGQALDGLDLLDSSPLRVALRELTTTTT